MGAPSRISTKIFVAALLVATMALNPKPLRASQKTRHLKLSEKSKSGAEGSNIQVNCSVRPSRSPPPAELKWEWSKDDTSNVEQERVSKFKVALRITSLKKANAARYTCLLIMPDGAEEKAVFSLGVQQVKDEVCSKFQFKCEKTKHCLFLKYRCDNVDDCGDGSDEQCDVDPCLSKFRCNNSRCIDLKKVCNHVRDCDDHSDEQNCNVRPRPPSTAQPVSDDNAYAWLQITVSSFIAVILGLVFFISFIVIMVFRNRVRRLREQRIARALERVYMEDERLNRHGDNMGGPRDPPSGGQGQPSDQQQFLLGPPHPHYGNIIVNVNNGVQYIPGYDYAIMMDVPPPYSEVGTTHAGEANPPPPAYSTLEHQNMSRMGGSAQSAVSTEDHASPSASFRHLHPAERCATVPASDICSGESPLRANGRPASDVCSGESTLSANCRPYQTNSSVGESSSNTQTLPSGIDINPHFLQSLLSPRVPAWGGERNASTATGDSDNVAAPNMPAAQDCGVHIVHLTASPRHGAASSPPAQRNTVDQGGAPASNPNTQSVPLGLADGHGETVLPSASDYMGTSGLSGEDCSQSYGAQWEEEEEEEEESAAAVEDSTFLLRRPKPKASEENQPPPASSPSTALLTEVSKRDDKLRPKAGNLTVQAGEIMLQTPAGILTVPSLTPPIPSSVVSSDPAELTIQNGALVFGSPKPAAKCEQKNSPQNHQSQIPIACASAGVKSEQFSHVPLSSSQTQPDHGDAAATANPSEMSDTLRRKELQFKNGELVLESPKHTPSAQILSHLKGAYAEEEGMAEPIEPVVNTKRNGASGPAKSQTQKFNSDVVLPPKNYQNQQ